MSQAKQSYKESLSKDKALEVCQNIIAKIRRIRTLHLSATEKVENATENTIWQFSSLVERLKVTTTRTNEILDMMKEKVSLGIVKDTLEKHELDSTTVQKKYEKLLKEVTEQLSLIIQVKTEDADRLNTIKKRINSLADQMESEGRSDSEQGSAEKIEELRSISHFIENSATSMEEAIDIESRFIRSTILLLQDVVLSLVSSFIQINSIMDNTLGESSSVRDEINAIIINLQCEDVCCEMSRYTLEILSSVIDDLHDLEIGEIPVDKTDPEEEVMESGTMGGDDEDVTFF